MPGKLADFLRIGHRGSCAEYPENTLVSFRRALEQGAQMIECDLQLTADGHVAVIHDWTLERTSDGEGAVRETSLADLQKLDAGSWKDPRFAGERIPTLDETLDTVLPGGRLNLELKCRGSEEDARRLALSAVAAVSQRDAFDRVIFSSFDATSLEALRDVSSEARIGVLWIFDPFDDAFALADRLGAGALHPRAEAVDVGVVEAARERGLAVNAWTVNEPAAMLDLVRTGVDGIISDYPGRLLEVRARLLGGEG
ncbi:MAG: glycerophosphodiester phosphodiesterase family protein [Candidatus Binatia bacterium]|nr:glycerophosphodiester phosphodiesterase family protein [Candidatus Binatia bacterium]